MLTSFSRAGLATPAIYLKCLFYFPQSLCRRTGLRMFSVSHKTAFVVDHCPYMAESCRQLIECDMLTKSRSQGVIPLAPVSKSLWTCAIECSMEYCRILFDVYPTWKLVNYIVSDSEVHILNSWKQEDQNTHELMAALAAVGPPNPRQDPECCSVLHGLVAAVESLCKITEYQHESRTTLMDTADRVANRGRIICLTNAKSDTHVRMLEDCVLETIQEQNKRAAGSDRLMPIQQCELVLVHIYPQGEETLVSDRQKKELSSMLSSEVHSVRAGRYLASKLNVLVQQHFDLASTTITNIPMKEEQHANTSANYDVELLHHRDAHMEFIKSGDLHMAGSTSRDSGLKETVTLKWCTPRTNSVELHYCTGAYRISPVDVNSRPSSCLTNFLLNDSMIDAAGRTPVERAKSQLERYTRYWPMIISQTTIFNMQAVVPLANLIVKDTLTDEDVLTCQKTVYNLVDMERKSDPLPISTVGSRGKGPKRDEQYRIMWNELETLVKAHVGTSERHQRVLECISACRSKPPEEEERKKRGRKREDKEDKTEKNGKDTEEKGWTTDSERLKGVMEREKDEQSECEIIKDSPDSPEPLNKKPRLATEEQQPPEKSKGPVSLLTLWTNRITQANSRKHQEFAGRLSSVNNKAELYQHLKEENGCVDLTVSLAVYPVNTLISHFFVYSVFCLLGWMFMRMEKPPDDVWSTPLLISAGSLIC
uniref:Integrator complex subunit 13 n=1 Tax=Cyprinus carpio carpio TaxID=630221 RepID=A0A9J8BIJ9_CYPCA